jgi:glycerol 3-phosphatase-2
MILDARGALARYEAVRHRMPNAHFPNTPVAGQDLNDIAGDVDLFILDAYGVLNVGATPIPGAVETVNGLQRQGKLVMVLTNGATVTAAQALAKYQGFGLEFDRWQVVSSRELAATEAKKHNLRWALASRLDVPAGEFGNNTQMLLDDPDVYEQADGFVLLSAGTWSPRRQAMLLDTLLRRPRPLLVGNPDLVAPNEHAFSIEPGYFAHEIADATEVEPDFYGKPYGNAFAGVMAQLEAVGNTAPSPQRTVMVGDSLHTDILGGAAAGFRTALITSHGLFRGIDPQPFIDDTGIRPDYLLTTT